MYARSLLLYTRRLVGVGTALFPLPYALLAPYEGVAGIYRAYELYLESGRPRV